MQAPKQENTSPRTGIELPDIVVLLLLMTTFAGMFFIASHWFAPLTTQTREIDLSLLSLPKATFLSLGRIFLAYLISLCLTIIWGYLAAHSPAAERILIPLVDILQCVPALGFLPGVLLFLITIFPNTSIGLEIASILLIISGMAWNMILSFYASIKNIPREYQEIMTAYRYSRLGILLRLEIPFAIKDLVWNSMLSIAGGWFFLTICESFTFGGTSYRLLGIGSYMAYAAEKGDFTATLYGFLVVVSLLVLTDKLIWGPLLNWAERFQKHSYDDDDEEESGVISFFASSRRITRVIRRLRRYYSNFFYSPPAPKRSPFWNDRTKQWFLLFSYFVTALLCVSGIYITYSFVSHMQWQDWLEILKGAGFSFLRVFSVLFLCTSTMIPLGLWLGSQPQLIRRFKTVIQVIASFPAPMIFPVLTSLILWCSIPMSIGSVFLMMMGAQWYLLFNVIAGASSVPREFVEVAKTTGMNYFQILRRVYLPTAMPQIITGIVTAAGGAWNTSIVAELVNFRGQRYQATGLGSYIALAAENQKYAELIAAVGVMVLLIIFVNRFLWAKLFTMVEAKFRL